MTYLLQVTTKDFGLQLKTEVIAESIEQLQYLAANMVKRNQSVIGKKYIIAQYVKESGKLVAKTLKTGLIEG